MLAAAAAAWCRHRRKQFVDLAVPGGGLFREGCHFASEIFPLLSDLWMFMGGEGDGGRDTGNGSDDFVKRPKRRRPRSDPPGSPVSKTVLSKLFCPLRLVSFHWPAGLARSVLRNIHTHRETHTHKCRSERGLASTGHCRGTARLTCIFNAVRRPIEFFHRALRGKSRRAL